MNDGLRVSPITRAHPRYPFSRNTDVMPVVGARDESCPFAHFTQHQLRCVISAPDWEDADDDD